MTTEKFHCHPTIILEKAGGVIIASILILLSQAGICNPVFPRRVCKRRRPALHTYGPWADIAPPLLYGWLPIPCMAQNLDLHGRDYACHRTEHPEPEEKYLQPCPYFQCQHGTKPV